MRNIDLLKTELSKKIADMDAEALYLYVLQPEPFVPSLCKFCEETWGECPETNKDDSICISRFKAWSELEVK